MELRRKLTVVVTLIAVGSAACSSSDSGEDAAATTDNAEPPSTEQLLVEVPEAPSPLRVTPGFGPVPFPASDGRTHLDYELYLTSRSSEDLTVTSISVVNADDPSDVVVELSGDDLDDYMTSDADASVEGPAIPAGMSSIAYIDTSVAAAGDVPDTLMHVVEGVDDDGDPFPTIEGAFTQPLDIDLTMLAPPVSDGTWIAAEGCCFRSHHRRPPLTLNGEDFLSQTYAIDFIKVEDGDLWEGDDPKDLDSWFTYGQDALAVVDGTVSSVLEDEDDITPFEPNPIPRTIDNVTGNHVIIDIGNGQYVVYAHLQPDSVVVEEGDDVKVGDKLALVGNSGNTDAPHLHIHMMDANHTIRANPIPFGFESYDLLGSYLNIDNLLPEPFGEVGPGDPELLETPEHIADAYPLELDLLEFSSE